MNSRDKYQYLKGGHWVSSAYGVHECPSEISRDYGWGCTLTVVPILIAVGYLLIKFF